MIADLCPLAVVGSLHGEPHPLGLAQLCPDLWVVEAVSEGGGDSAHNLHPVDTVLKLAPAAFSVGLETITQGGRKKGTDDKNEKWH